MESAGERQLWRQAMDAYNNDRPAEALAHVRRYNQLHAENVWGWVLRASLLVDLARYDEARSALAQAFRIAPTDARKKLFSQVGRIYDHKGDYRRAILWFRRATKVDPQTTTWIFLGAALAKLGRLSEAEQCHRNAIALDTDCVDEAYFNLGLILRAKERYQEALTCFENAIHLDPQYRVAKTAKRDVAAALRLRNARPKETS
jgi:tetratricopeptide (TPR) repeat protein